MAKPLKCPGECIYCPNSLVGKPTPKSYTGLEPATMRALANNFDAFAQVKNRLAQLKETGHSTDKIELIVMGGTFAAAQFPYQKKFMLGCLNAITSKKHSSLAAAQRSAETSKVRLTGLTFESRPDFCGKKEINRFLEFGGTRVELGVQNPDNSIFKRIHRNHSVEDVIEATRLLKDSAFKVCYHLMPGLPFSDTKRDLKNFHKIFSDSSFRPDMLKIYPCIVTDGTEIHEMFKQGAFKPLSTEQAASFIACFKQSVPRWVRIMRIQRDIPSTAILAGPNATNLRQLVEKKLLASGKRCNCIRCREAARENFLHNKPFDLSKARLFIEEYDASAGIEQFISLEDKKRELLFGYCRLRLPFAPFHPEINSRTALLRELRVFSSVVPLGKLPEEQQLQHRGIGSMLLKTAEEKALQEFDKNKMVVIAGLGVKEYYRKLGYKDDGPFVSKVFK
jgi:elongator complex protein 3